jgi:uracil-DNA glycosylase family 4
VARSDLDAIYARVEADPYWDHLRGPGIRLVPGFGSYAPEVLVVGEAPGATENTRLRPFCGASGRVLLELMALSDLRVEDRSEVPDGTGDQFVANTFMTNVVKYHPLGNRTPTVGEALYARDVLREEWAALGKPRVIVAVGNTAQTALGVGPPLNPRGVPYYRSGTTFWPMYHPAFAMRHKAVRQEVEGHWEELGRWRVAESSGAS